LPVADVDERGVDLRLAPLADHHQILEHPRRGAVLAEKLNLDAVERAAIREQHRQLFAFVTPHEEVGDIRSDQLGTRIAEHAGEGEIAVDDQAGDVAHTDAGSVLLEEQAVAQLRLAKHPLRIVPGGDVAKAPDANRDTLDMFPDRVALETAPILELEPVETLGLRLRVERVHDPDEFFGVN